MFATVSCPISTSAIPRCRPLASTQLFTKARPSARLQTAGRILSLPAPTVVLLSSTGSSPSNFYTEPRRMDCKWSCKPTSGCSPYTRKIRPGRSQRRSSQTHPWEEQSNYGEGEKEIRLGRHVSRLRQRDLNGALQCVPRSRGGRPIDCAGHRPYLRRHPHREHHSQPLSAAEEF